MRPEDDASRLAKQDSRVRLGGLIAGVGLVLYGAMFVTFGITDEDVTEIVGGLGIVLVGIGAFIATRRSSRTG